MSLLPFLQLPAFAESPVRKGGDECEKGIHRSLLTAIASAAAVGEGGSASAGSVEDVKIPRAAARGALLVPDDSIHVVCVAHDNASHLCRYVLRIVV